MRFQDSALEEFPSAAVSPPPLPASVARSTANIEYYRVNPKVITYAEWWRMTQGPSVLLAWIAKLLGFPFGGGNRVPRPRDWRELEIAAQDIPCDVLEKLTPKVTELSELGFSSPVFLYLPNPSMNCETYVVMLASPSHDALARVNWLHPLKGCRMKEVLDVFFLSGFADGRFYTTSQKPGAFVTPPNCICQHRRAPVRELWRLHQQEITALARVVQLIPVDTPEDLWTIFSAYDIAAFSFHEGRGLYVALSAAQTAQ